MQLSALSRALVAIAALTLILPATAAAKPPPKTGSITQVGHDPLMDRGMNAAMAIHGDYAYIGSRTDGAHEDMPHGGIMVVDISDPSDPELVTEEPLYAAVGESSRELRVWQSQEILIVLNTNCGGATAHHCTGPSQNSIRFYDISGEHATSPQLIAELEQNTHEFFLWEDPTNPERALMYGGSAGNSCPSPTAMTCAFRVWDLSPLLVGQAPAVLFSGLHGFTRFPAQPAPAQIPTGSLHSLSISNDGTRAYFALLTGGFAVVDVSDFAAARPLPQPRPITVNSSRPVWSGPGAHSAVKLWEKDWVYVSDEVYGTATGDDHGCPWGWARMVDISDPLAPTVEAEFRLPENFESSCAAWNPPRTSYSAHNPTVSPRIVLTTWHSGGFQMINVQHPWAPYQLAEFFPDPPDEVMLEDPRLSDGSRTRGVTRRS